MSSTELERMAADERKAYYKRWREANKHRTAEHRRRFFEKKALEKLERQKEAAKRAGGEDIGRASHQIIDL